MIDIAEDPRRIEVWVAMADQFLDTETRHDIPLIAMRCVRAGLSTAEALDVWRYEVSPAVEFNVWDVAGEWAGWDQDWLVKEIQRHRERRGRLSCRWLRHRLGLDPLHGVWVSIGRCMEALLEAPSPADRERMAEDLAFLARHYFDFCAKELDARQVLERERLGALYPEPFLRLIAPAAVRGEALAAEGRVRAALRLEAQP